MSRSIALARQPINGENARSIALQAIENNRGALVQRHRLPDTFTIIDSFRRPDGIWWMRAFSEATQREVQKLVVPIQPYTNLKPDSSVTLTRITCGDCTYYEAT